jgi:hypothetical protein
VFLVMLPVKLVGLDQGLAEADAVRLSWHGWSLYWRHGARERRQG